LNIAFLSRAAAGYFTRMAAAIDAALIRGDILSKKKMAPTNPNNCNEKYKEIIKPKSWLWSASPKTKRLETLMQHNFMNAGILDNKS
jgi:hypothetical protein